MSVPPRSPAGEGDGGEIAFPVAPLLQSHSPLFFLSKGLDCIKTELLQRSLLWAKIGPGPQRFHVLEVWAKIMKLTNGLIAFFQFRKYMPSFIFERLYTFSYQNKKGDSRLNIEIGLQLLFTIEYKFVHVNSSSTLFCEAIVTNYILVLFFSLTVQMDSCKHWSHIQSSFLNSRIPKENLI